MVNAERLGVSLRFALLVTGAPYGSQSASQAYQFACELIRQGHILRKVFFYQDGVQNANHLTSPANDEFNLVQAWQTLALEHGIELDVCVAAALRRGVVDAREAETGHLPAANTAEPFVLSGLGQLAEAALDVDRLVQF